MKKVILLTLFCCGMMLCASEVRHLYMCRKCEAVAVKAGRPDILYCPAKGSHNWLLYGAMALSFVLTTAVVEIDFLCNAFELAHLNLREYGIAMGLAILIIPIVEIVKIFRRRIDRKKEETSTLN